MLKSYGIKKNGISTFQVVGFSFMDEAYLWFQNFPFLFYATTDNIVENRLYNTVVGRTDEYLIVEGIPGEETYQCPDTMDYREADINRLWFNNSSVRRTVTKKDLVCWDISRTPIKFDDDYPNTIRIIAIMNKDAVVLPEERNYLFDLFQLPIFWDDSFNDYGHFKDRDIIGAEYNIPYGYSPWNHIVEIDSSIISLISNNKVVLTTLQRLDISSVPATTDFSIPGKTISLIEVAEYAITITISTYFEYNNSYTLSYTKPVINFIKSLGGSGELESFTAMALVNNISYPSVLTDGKTKGFYDWTQISTITKDVNDLVSGWSDRLGSERNLAAAGSYRAIYSATDGMKFTGGGKRFTISTTLTTPQFVYLVMRVKSYLSGLQTIIDGQSAGTMRLDMINNTQMRMYMVGSADYIYPTIFPLNNWYIVRLSFKGAGSFIKIGTTSYSNNNLVAASISGFMLGGDSVFARYSDIEVKECIIRAGGSETIIDETTIYNYLKAKYGL